MEVLRRGNCAKLLIIVMFITAPIFAIGDPKPSHDPAPSWLEHWDLARATVALLFSALGIMIMKALNKFEKNQDEIFSRLREAEKTLAEIKGKCERTHNG